MRERSEEHSTGMHKSELPTWNVLIISEKWSRRYFEEDEQEEDDIDDAEGPGDEGVEGDDEAGDGE